MCATSTGTSPRGCNAAACAPVHRRPRALAAWFLLDLSASVDFGSNRQHQARGRSRSSWPCWRGCSRATATASAPCCTGSSVDGVLPPRARPHACAAHCCSDGRAAPTGARAADRDHRTDLLRAARQSAASHRAPLDGLRGLGLHQRARLGARLGPAGAAPRGGGRAPVRRARAGAARPRPGDDRETPRPASRLLVDTSATPAFASASRIAAVKREADLRKALGASAGVDTLELGGTDLVDSILRFTELKKQRSRLANCERATRSLAGPASVLRHDDGPHVALLLPPEAARSRLGAA